VFGTFAALCHEFDVADEISVSIKQLFEEHQDLMEMEALVQEDFNLNEFTFSVIPNPSSKEVLLDLVGSELVVLVPRSLAMGSHTFGVVVAFWGDLQLIGQDEEAVHFKLEPTKVITAAKAARIGDHENLPAWGLINDAGFAVKQIDPDALIYHNPAPTVVSICFF